MKIQVNESEDKEKWGREWRKKRKVICYHGVYRFSRCEQKHRCVFLPQKMSSDTLHPYTASQKSDRKEKGDRT